MHIRSEVFVGKTKDLKSNSDMKKRRNKVQFACKRIILALCVKINHSLFRAKEVALIVRIFNSSPLKFSRQVGCIKKKKSVAPLQEEFPCTRLTLSLI